MSTRSGLVNIAMIVIVLIIIVGCGEAKPTNPIVLHTATSIPHIVIIETPSDAQSSTDAPVSPTVMVESLIPTAISKPALTSSGGWVIAFVSNRGDT